MKVAALLTEAQTIIAPFLKSGGYAVAYGSHATATARRTSDLDLLTISDAPLEPASKQKLISAVIALHHNHGLHLDTEVTYDVKLHATNTAMRHAVSLHAFSDNTGGLTVPAIDDAAKFLNSHRFLWRLLLGAITSPHVFLAGDLAAYRSDTAAAELTIGLVATALVPIDAAFTTAQATEVLLRPPRRCHRQRPPGVPVSGANVGIGATRAGHTDLSPCRRTIQRHHLAHPPPAARSPHRHAPPRPIAQLRHAYPDRNHQLLRGKSFVSCVYCVA